MFLEFTKMHGLGNDFVVIDAVHQALRLSAQQVRLLSDRRRGVGCDQVLVVEPPRHADADFFYRIFNADGGEVEQCGNGARCFARFVRDRGLTDKDELRVDTVAGPLRLRIEPDGQVAVDMGAPRFVPADIPFDAEAYAPLYPLALKQGTVSIGAVSMGNPHAVLQVDDVAVAPVQTVGAEIEAHPRFPNRVNAGFMQVLDRGHIRLRVYERGVGETLACGSGACAAVAVGRQQGLLDDTVLVQLPGGTLRIQWHGEETSIWMTGEATRVFEGRIEL